MERKCPTSEARKCPTFTKILILCNVIGRVAPRRGAIPCPGRVRRYPDNLLNSRISPVEAFAHILSRSPKTAQIVGAGIRAAKRGQMGATWLERSTG
jgi:hypothetical protein